jgi:hypothetical protein
LDYAYYHNVFYVCLLNEGLSLSPAGLSLQIGFSSGTRKPIYFLSVMNFYAVYLGVSSFKKDNIGLLISMKININFLFILFFRKLINIILNFKIK